MRERNQHIHFTSRDIFLLPFHIKISPLKYFEITISMDNGSSTMFEEEPII